MLIDKNWLIIKDNSAKYYLNYFYRLIFFCIQIVVDVGEQTCWRRFTPILVIGLAFARCKLQKPLNSREFQCNNLKQPIFCQLLPPLFSGQATFWWHVVDLQLQWEVWKPCLLMPSNLRSPKRQLILCCGCVFYQHKRQSEIFISILSGSLLNYADEESQPPVALEKEQYSTQLHFSDDNICWGEFGGLLLLL